jgi:methylated-DNA-[protein]-cysteine S-methyltransferase
VIVVAAFLDLEAARHAMGSCAPPPLYTPTRATIPATMAAVLGFALFSTAIGHCGIAWSARGLVGVYLPEASEALLRTRMAKRFAPAPEAPVPAACRAAVDDMTALLRGESRDLLDVPLDLDGHPDFHRAVWAIARHIAPGQTRTYGEIAHQLNDPGASRAVGQALGRNAFPLVVPCHRVLAAHGGLGGFSAPGGQITKRRLLAIEGARVTEAAPDLFDDEAGGPR